MDQFLKAKPKPPPPKQEIQDIEMEEDDEFMQKAKEMPKYVPWVEK
jgi:hypothetical protein